MEIKSKTLLEKIPEYTVERKEFCCPECDFSSRNKEDVERHYANKHACKNVFTVGGKTFMLFTSEEDIELYSRYDSGDDSFIKWCGSGWYHVYSEDQPCRRGCCTDWVTCYVPIKEALNNIREEARELLITVRDVKRKMADEQEAQEKEKAR